MFFFKPTCGSDPNQIQALARWDAETETYKLKAGVHLEVLWQGGGLCDRVQVVCFSFLSKFRLNILI